MEMLVSTEAKDVLCRQLGRIMRLYWPPERKKIKN